MHAVAHVASGERQLLDISGHARIAPNVCASANLICCITSIERSSAGKYTSCGRCRFRVIRFPRSVCVLTRAQKCDFDVRY